MAILYEHNSRLFTKLKNCEANMDNLLLFTPSKSSHMEKIEDLLKALLKNRLKISLRKCQLLRTEMQYMGNMIFLSKTGEMVSNP